MKQEWFESNDFVKTTSKNKPEEQAQDVADKAEETIADLDTPIEKNTQVEEEVSQAEVELENQQEEKIETPEDSEARTEIEEKKALDSTEEEQDLSEGNRKKSLKLKRVKKHFLSKNNLERATSYQSILRKSLYPRPSSKIYG